MKELRSNVAQATFKVPFEPEIIIRQLVLVFQCEEEVKIDKLVTYY